jgi:hypothetical protein
MTSTVENLMEVRNANGHAVSFIVTGDPPPKNGPEWLSYGPSGHACTTAVIESVCLLGWSVLLWLPKDWLYHISWSMSRPYLVSSSLGGASPSQARFDGARWGHCSLSYCPSLSQEEGCQQCVEICHGRPSKNTLLERCTT